VGIGALAQRVGNALLSAIAAAVVAVAFSPVRRWAQRLANRVVYGKRATPYEVLSDFSERVAGSYSVDDVLPRMARVLAEGVGATRVTVWLDVGAHLRPVGSWPPDDWADDEVRSAGELPDGVFDVRHQGDLLGAITVAMPPSEPLDPVRERLAADLAGQAGLVLRNVRLIEELRESRRRIVTAQDERARKLERDIHDGAQQQLVALAVKLRLADQLVEGSPAKARELLDQLQAETSDALEDLRDLARGIYPPLLADKGLAAALEAQARKVPVPVDVTPNGVGRYPQDIEAAVYFCVLEALQNVAKYADASRVEVRLSHEGQRLTFEVRDDGRGFDPSSAGGGIGLQGMADRLEAIGGHLRIDSAPGAGTRISGSVTVPTVP
jgi:signal transduction histidine kinase